MDDPVRRNIVSKYLVRVWPAGGEPPELQQSEMSCAASASEGEGGNDRAEILAIRGWAQNHANAEGVPYSYEVNRDTMVATLTGSGSTTRVVNQVSSGTVEPRKHAN